MNLTERLAQFASFESPEAHALRLFDELARVLLARGGSIRISTADARFWAIWIKQTESGREGPVGPVVTDNTLRGALANLLEAITQTRVPQCKQCKGPGADPHPCPYQSEVNKDDTPCTCCEACAHQCSEEI